MVASELPAGDILIAFDLRQGLLACFRTRIVRSRHLDDADRDYGIRFLDRVPEPNQASAFDGL